MSRKTIVFKKNTKNKLEKCKQNNESISEVITRLTKKYHKGLKHGKSS